MHWVLTYAADRSQARTGGGAGRAVTGSGPTPGTLRLPPGSLPAGEAGLPPGSLPARGGAAGGVPPCWRGGAAGGVSPCSRWDCLRGSPRSEAGLPPGSLPTRGGATAGVPPCSRRGCRRGPSLLERRAAGGVLRPAAARERGQQLHSAGRTLISRLTGCGAARGRAWCGVARRGYAVCTASGEGGRGREPQKGPRPPTRDRGLNCAALRGDGNRTAGYRSMTSRFSGAWQQIDCGLWYFLKGLNPHTVFIFSLSDWSALLAFLRRIFKTNIPTYQGKFALNWRLPITAESNPFGDT